MLQTLFENQRNLINFFFETLDLENAEKIVDVILSCPKTLYFSEVGKSGIIAKKIADTFSSLGTKAFYLSPSDALHGDIGRLESGDLFILLSKSGFTGELIELIPYVKKRGLKVVSLVCSENTPLQKLADLSIYLPLQKELCPFNLAPTTSTTIQLIFGDILAVAIMQKKSLQKEVYAQNHPAGSIGKKLNLQVKDIMKKDRDIPLCHQEDLLIDVLPILSKKRCGAVIVVEKENLLVGIFTDGDLRRALQNDPREALYKPIKFLMNPSPKFIYSNTLAIEALNYMEKDPDKLIMVLPILENQKVCGIIHLHDILQVGLKG